MKDSGGKSKPKKIFVEVKFPPKRTAREWRELNNMKLRQYESIGFEIMGKRSKFGSGE